MVINKSLNERVHIHFDIGSLLFLDKSFAEESLSQGLVLSVCLVGDKPKSCVKIDIWSQPLLRTNFTLSDNLNLIFQ